MHLATVLTLLFAASPPPAEDGEAWWLVESPSFSVMSDAGEATARRTAKQLEHIRAVFALAMPAFPPTTGPGPQGQGQGKLSVLAAKNEKTLAMLLPHLEDGGRRDATVGMFFRTAHASFIVLRTDAPGESPYDVVYHEYFHALANPVMPRAPLWFQEGLASLWENTTIAADRVEMARPSGIYLQVLKQGRLIPLEELLATDRASSRSRDGHRRTLFYAQSWALVHYIMLGDETGKLRDALGGYLEAVDSGADPTGAFEDHLGPVRAMEDALRGYVRRFQFQALRMASPPEPDVDGFASRRVEDAELHARLGHYFVLTQRSEEAERHTREALRLEPTSAVAHETAGLLYYLDGDGDEARASFETARSRDATRSLPWFFLALLRAERLASVEDLAFVRESFEQAVGLDPSHAPSLSRLSLLYRADNAKRELALTLSERSAALAPDDPVAHTAHGIALKQTGRTSQAVRALERALRLDPSAELALEELVEARAVLENPFFGLWQYESYQIWLRISDDGAVFRCRVDTDGTVHRTYGTRAGETVSWRGLGDTAGETDALVLKDGRLTMRGANGTVTFERTFIMSDACGEAQ